MPNSQREKEGGERVPEVRRGRRRESGFMKREREKVGARSQGEERGECQESGRAREWVPGVLRTEGTRVLW